MDGQINGQERPIETPNVEINKPQAISRLAAEVANLERFRNAFLIERCTFVGGVEPLLYETIEPAPGHQVRRVVGFQMKDRICFQYDHFPHITVEQLQQAITAVQDEKGAFKVEEVCAQLQALQFDKYFKAPDENPHPAGAQR